jgi:hypothetical protein
MTPAMVRHFQELLQPVVEGTVRGAKARLAVGEVHARLEEACRQLFEGRPHRALPGQLPFAFRVQDLQNLPLAPENGELWPMDVVRCRLGAKLFVQACLDHRSAVWPSGGDGTRRRVDGSVNRGRQGKPKHPECQGCPVGEAYAARAPWHVPPKPSQPREVMEQEQRAAKERWQAERGFDDQPWLDPLKQAADLTPDDEGTDC